MSDPFVGEIRVFGFNFPPVGWAFCQGQLIPISQNPALFSILGTTYGGNGTSNFGLPNLMERGVMHWGNGPGLTPRVLGEEVGESSVTLISNEIPPHTHTLQGGDPAVALEETGVPGPTAWPGPSNPGKAYLPNAGTLNTQFSPKAISPQGSSLPHQNLQPILAMNFCIALEGIFPQRP